MQNLKNLVQWLMLFHCKWQLQISLHLFSKFFLLCSKHYASSWNAWWQHSRQLSLLEHVVPLSCYHCPSSVFSHTEQLEYADSPAVPNLRSFVNIFLSVVLDSLPGKHLLLLQVPRPQTHPILIVAIVFSPLI